MITDEQNGFLYSVGPLIKAIPESKQDISSHTGVPVRAINDLVGSRNNISQPHLHKLVEYFNCRYRFHQWEDGHTVHDFSLTGGYTVFPKGKKQIIDLYENNSHGGDLVFAHELVQASGHVYNHTRYILLHTCYQLYTLMIIKEQSDIVDNLIRTKALINFAGQRAISDEFSALLGQHEFDIMRNPGARRAIDSRFFSDKHLAFSQIPLSYPPRDDHGFNL